MSAFLNPRGHPARLISRWRTGALRVIISSPLLDELSRVLARPRLQRIRPYSETEARLFVLMIEAGAKVVIPTGQFHACRDATDDMELETALIGRAKYIVSRDADVTRDLSLVRVFRTHGIRILTVDRLLHLLSANR